jgi:hypothetical protein
MRPNQTLGFEEIHRFLAGLFNGGPHAKRVLSLSNATLGVIMTASLAVSIIGQGLALARGLITRHAIKQVDRLLSNEGIDIDAALRHWVPYVVGSRTDIRVAMDWTDFDADGQTTIMLSLMTRHGRATPLAWLTVAADTLKNNCNEYEYQILVRLADALPAGIKVCIVADRGFGDQKLYRFLTEPLKFDYVIRFRGNIGVTSADGDERAAIGWVGPGGRATLLRGALVTAERYQVGCVVCVRDKDMNQPHGCDGRLPEEPIWQTLARGSRIPGHEGSAFRHGNGNDPRQHPRPARPVVAAECARHRLADVAGRCRRGPRLRSLAEVEYNQTTHPFIVPSGLHAVRLDPDHARATASAADRALRCHAPGSPGVRRVARHDGWPASDTRMAGRCAS